MSVSLPEGWTGDRRAIRRTYLFDDFAQAIAYMVEVAYHCEARNHHPAWANLYDRLDVTLTTHDMGCVTTLDIALAETMNEVYARSGVKRFDGQR